MLNNLLLTGATDEKNYIEDLFSVTLYTGNGSTQTITNGIDLAGKGGLVWIKSRGVAGNNRIFDTARTGLLSTNTTSAEGAGYVPTYFNFSSDGFSIPNTITSFINDSNATYASWTFRKAPKFFDVVTYTGSGASGKVINHSLGIAPGMIILKRTDSAAAWVVWNRTFNGSQYLFLNETSSIFSDAPVVNFSNVNASSFQIDSTWSSTNASGASYVAYLFAHDTTADGVIQCGSFTTDASGNATVNLGWEPQFILSKRTDSSTGGDWWLFDDMRGWPTGSNEARLLANTSGAETSGANYGNPTSTGFVWAAAASASYIYLAIRRGPMRVPTDATKVFSPSIYTGAIDSSNANNRLIESTDLWLSTNRAAAAPYALDRLRGWSYFRTSSTAAENTGTTWTQTNQTTLLPNAIWWGSISQVDYYFRRAPGFFDVVCYTASYSANPEIKHNLGVAPELVIAKSRTGTRAWYVAGSVLGGKWLNLNDTAGSYTSTTYTGTAIYFKGQDFNWPDGSTHVAYLFASCPGVSKVGSYTGNGSSQNIDCGFTNGARFVLIKRTDSTGDWYVWDTARGIVAANDPHLSLNSTAAEVTTNDSIDPLSTGFTVNQNATTNVNVSGATYIYLAIA